MKKIISKLAALVMALTVLCSIAAPSAFAASAITRTNVSYSPVSCNASDGSLPTGTSTVTVGDSVHFNIQVDSSQKLKTVVLYVKPVGASSYTKQATETATNYLRYCDFTYKVPSTAEGTMYYYFKTTNTGGTTSNTSTGSVAVKKASTSSVDQKINAFINDARWKNGISWGASQTPKLSSHQSWGCCAYAADFAKYVYGKASQSSGTKYTAASAIKTGDIIYVTPQHWIVIVNRSGSTLKVAEGNCSSKVRITSYKLSGSKLLKSDGTTYKTFSYGFHF